MVATNSVEHLLIKGEGSLSGTVLIRSTVAVISYWGILKICILRLISKMGVITEYIKNEAVQLKRCTLSIELVTFGCSFSTHGSF